MDRLLNRIVNVAVILACAAVVIHLSLYAYHLRTPAVPPVYAKGAKIPDTKELGFSSAQRTLILVTHSQCHFCQESMPFYKRLTNAAHKEGVRVVGLSAEDLAVHRDFLTWGGLYVDFVGSMAVNGIKVRGTPTLIEVDRRGVVLSSWEGTVSPAKEPDMEASLIPGR